MSGVRVLVVDDSAYMRRQITALLEEDGQIRVVGIARNGEEALTRVAELKPDVVTLDINMPVMDGLTALVEIMEVHPTPCVMVSSLTQDGAAATVEALALGAVDYVGKPSGTVSLDIETQAHAIRAAVLGAARARLRGRAAARPRSNPSRPPREPRPQATAVEARSIVVIGVSTGGPQTLAEILPDLAHNFAAPIVVVQHMPPKFTASLARRLDQACALTVKEAEHNDALLPGTVYIAPGGQHLTVVRSTLGRGPIINLSSRPHGLEFCPSVNVLFESVAALYGEHAIGVLLTGMGDDGVDGMVKMRQQGAVTIAESEETAIVYGMPREAVERGAAQVAVPSHQIASELTRSITRVA